MDMGYMLVEENADNYSDDRQQRMNIVFEKLTGDQRKIAEVLDSNTPMHIDEIIGCCSLTTEKTLSAITELEIYGLVTQLSGRRYKI